MQVTSDLALLATTDGATVLITMINRVSAAPRRVHLSLPGWRARWREASAVLLRAEGILPHRTRTVGGAGWYAEPRAMPLMQSEDGGGLDESVPLELPPYSLVQVSVSVQQ